MDFDAVVGRIEGWAGQRLPEAYLAALRTHGGATFESSVVLYAPGDVVERNETFESKKYCPGNIAIGDDGGGRAVMIPLQSASCPVSLVDHGSMDAEDFHRVAENLTQWIEARCPVK